MGLDSIDGNANTISEVVRPFRFGSGGRSETGYRNRI